MHNDFLRMRALWVAMRVGHTGQNSNAEKKFFAKEFSLLWYDKRVHRLRMRPDGIFSLETRKIIWLDPTTGWHYYIGKSRIILDTHNARLVTAKAGESVKVEGFEIVHTHTGRFDRNMLGLYYMQPTGLYPGNFCFGDRNDYVRQLIAQKEHFTLITTVLESLFHVNKEEHDHVRKEYRRIFSDGTMEAKKPSKSIVAAAVDAMFGR